MDVTIAVPDGDLLALILTFIATGWTIFQEIRHNKNRGSVFSAWKKK